MGPNVRDANLKLTLALPASTSAVVSSSLDLETTSRSDFVARCETLLTAPALNTSQLPDTKTMTYDLIASSSSNLSSPTVLVAGAIVQTGAGGVGAAGSTYRFKPASNVLRYFGFRATPSASGAGNASAANGTLEMLV